MKSTSIAFIVLVVVAITAGASLLWWFFTPHLPWLFRGAYGTYAGGYTMGSTYVDAKAYLEVLDYNSTHVTLLQRITAGTSEGTSEDAFLVWFDLRTMNFPLEGLYLNRVYEEKVNFNGTARTCRVYEYDMRPGVTLIYFDKEATWILKQTVAVSDFHSEITLVETNIPGLKK